MQQYLELLRKVQSEGYNHSDRTGTGRRSLIGEQLRFKMSDGFPIVTTRKINPELFMKEMLWFISGSSSEAELNAFGVSFWDRWAVRTKHVTDFVKKFNLANRGDRDDVYETLKHFKDSIGNIYGPNWRNAPVGVMNTLWPDVNIKDIPKDKLAIYKTQYQGYLAADGDTDLTEEQFCQLSYRTTIDQLNELIINLRDRPYSSRLVVSAWVPEFIPFESVSPQENVLLGKGALAPCHLLYQCFVKPPQEEGDKPELSLLLYLRSADLPVGTPFNVAQYALLLHMLAATSNMEAGELIVNFGDVHIYKDQRDLIQEQLDREPLPLPKLILNVEGKSLFDITLNDISLEGYESHDPITYPVSV